MRVRNQFSSGLQEHKVPLCLKIVLCQKRSNLIMQFYLKCLYVSICVKQIFKFAIH